MSCRSSSTIPNHTKPYQTIPNHTKPNQTIPNDTKLIIKRSFKYFEKIEPYFVPSENNFSSIFPNSHVPCLMSNVQCQKSHVQLKLKILTILSLQMLIKCLSTVAQGGHNEFVKKMLIVKLLV